MTLPNFLIIGAPKSGTTSLAYHLGRHPDVFVSAKKEPDYFNRFYERGEAWYRGFFESAGSARAVGEASVHYSLTCWWPHTPERIARDLPDVKLIYMVRHPLDRLESMWCQHISTGLPLPPFNQAVREWRPLVDGSLYDHQLRRYLGYFPEERVLKLLFDDYVRDPDAVVAQACGFLGVDPARREGSAEENRNPRQNLRADRGPWKAVRNTPLGWACRRHVPEPAKAILRRVLRKPLDTQPVWERDTLRWAADQVREDAAAWLRRCGRSPLVWDLGDAYIESKLAAQPSARGRSRAAAAPTFTAISPQP